MHKMDEFEIQYAFLLTLTTLFFTWFLMKKLFVPNITPKNLPPSPSRLPIIGNLHQLGSLPHRTLHSLAKKHGPVMLLHLGSTPMLIISSAEAARECKKHDLDLAYRPKLRIAEQIFYNMKSLISCPYGEYWRNARYIFVHELLNNKKVQSFNTMMIEETALLMNKIEESCLSSLPIDLSAVLTSLSNDVICRSAFGKKYSETESGKKFIRVLYEEQVLLFDFSLGAFIPWLAWTNVLNGVSKKIEMVLKEGSEFLDEVIKKRSGKTRHENENFLDILLNIYNDNHGASIDMEGIKAIIKDVFGAGTETTSTLLEWAMTELLRHPAIMTKLQKEVREILHGKQDITFDDLEKMHYLKAVIKETFRYHPPVPLIPRKAGKDVKIMGYDIGAGTLVLINTFAIGRDLAFWDEPEMFEPERFLNSSIKFNGLNLQYIPFGIGRRICPGVGFSRALIELVLANLMQKFDWELPHGGKEDTAELRRLTVGRKNHLLVVATPCHS